MSRYFCIGERRSEGSLKELSALESVDKAYQAALQSVGI